MENRNPLEKVTLRQLMQVTYLGIPFPVAVAVALGGVLALIIFG